MLSRLVAAARAPRPCVSAPIRVNANAAAASQRTLTTMLQSAAGFRFAPLSARSSSPHAVAAAVASSASSSRRLHSSARSQQQQEQQQPPSRFDGPPGWVAPPRPPADFTSRYPPLRMPAAPTPWIQREGADLLAPLFPPASASDRVSVRSHLLQWCALLTAYLCLWAWGTAPDAEDEKAIRAARLSGWPQPIAWFAGLMIEGWIDNRFTCRRHFPQLAEMIHPRAAHKRAHDDAKQRDAAAAKGFREQEGRRVECVD